LAFIWTPWTALYAKGRAKLEILGWSGLVTLLILYIYLNEFRPFLYRGGFLVTAIASALLIIGASSPITSLSKLLEIRILRWIGTRSYSIYLWHWPIFMLTRPGIDIHLPTGLVRLGQLAITLGLAELSYRWIESPIRQRGFRWGMHAWQVALKQWSILQKLGVGAGIICTGLLLVWQGSRPLAESRSDIVSASQSTPAPAGMVDVPPTRPPSQNTQQAPGTSTPIHPTSAAQNDPRTIQSTPMVTQAGNLPGVTLIGDSIMQGAIPMMEDFLGPDIYIDAARKRRMEDIPALVEILAEEEHLGDTVVIHLGSNRPFEAPIFDQVMKSLLSHHVKRVILINVHRQIGWEYYVNEQFAEGVARWPQAELIDWETIAHSRQEWFIEDQTHLSYEGSEAYVTAIREKLEAAPK
jgi:hypothetical protein